MGLQRSHQRSRDKERVSATMERPQRHDIVLGSDAEELAGAEAARRRHADEDEAGGGVGVRILHRLVFLGWGRAVRGGGSRRFLAWHSSGTWCLSCLEA